jgi:exodeoxyribonuclease VII small subunit
MAKQKFNYSKSLKEIEEIVKQIESGKLDVDKLADKVRKATKLIEQCREKLRTTEEDLDRILKDQDQ